MRTVVAFAKRVVDADVNAGIVVLLPRGDALFDESDIAEIKKYATENDVVVVTPPFAQDGAIVMGAVWRDGEAWQRACFPAAGVAAGTDVEVCRTPHGLLALAPGEDIFQPQYARLCALKGCTLLIASTTALRTNGVDFPKPADLRNGGDAALLLAGPWSAAQANCLPVAVATPAGGALILPCTLTSDGSGFGRYEFDSTEMQAAYDAFPIFDCLNSAVYAGYREELQG